MNRFLLTPFLLDAHVPAMDRLATADWVVNTPPLSTGDTMTRMGGWQRPLADAVARTLAAGDRPISVCADCCQAIPMMAGLRRAGIAPTLIWFDAHGDFNTWETSPSGFIGGMSLAMLVGRGDQRLMESLELAPMPEADVVLTDARDLDPKERVSLEGSAVAHVGRAEELLSHVPADRPLYVHFDCDVIDADDAPATLYPVTGGPRLETMRTIARQLRDTGRIAAASITVWSLERDADRRTEQACMAVLGDLMG